MQKTMKLFKEHGFKLSFSMEKDGPDRYHMIHLINDDYHFRIMDFFALDIKTPNEEKSGFGFWRQKPNGIKKILEQLISKKHVRVGFGDLSYEFDGEVVKFFDLDGELFYTLNKEVFPALIEFVKLFIYRTKKNVSIEDRLVKKMHIALSLTNDYN